MLHSTAFSTERTGSSGVCDSWSSSYCIHLSGSLDSLSSLFLQVSVSLLISIAGLLCESEMISSFSDCSDLLNIVFNLAILVPSPHFHAKIKV